MRWTNMPCQRGIYHALIIKPFSLMNMFLQNILLFMLPVSSRPLLQIGLVTFQVSWRVKFVYENGDSVIHIFFVVNNCYIYTNVHVILRIKFNLLRVTHSREYILTSLKKKPRRIGHVSLYIQAVYVIPKQGNDCSKSDNFSETSVCSPDPSGRFNL